MKKTLVGLVAGVLALGVVTWLVKRDTSPPAPKSLEIPGYATPEQLAEDAAKGIMDTPVQIDHPVDEITIETKDGKVRLARSGEGKDATWRIEEPMSAVAVKFQVENMVKVFRDPTRSVHTKNVEAKDLPLFDLEPERRITVTLKSKGAVWNGVDLVLGKVQSSDSDATETGVTKDTWVMKRGEEAVVYRVGGKDLREPFDVGMDKLRDKKVFDVEAEDIVRVEVTSPAGEKLVLTGERKEPEKAPEGEAKPEGEAAEEKKAEVTWTIAVPAGIPPDDAAKTVARNIANARANDFRKPSEGPAEDVWKKAWKLEAKTFDDRTLSLEVTDEVDEKYWARIPGSEEVIEIQEYVASNLRKTVADVKDKTLFPIEDTAVTRLRYATETGGRIVVEKQGETWTFLEGGTGLADPSSGLKTLVKAKAQRWARPEEAAEAAAALATPDFTAEVAAGADSWTVAFGKLMDEDPHKNERWAQVTSASGPGEPFLVQDYVAKRFQKKEDELRWKRLLDFEKEAVQEVSIAWPGGAGDVTLSKDPASGDLVPASLPEGKKAKKSAITTILGTLPTLKAKDFKPGTTLEAAGLAEGKPVQLTTRLTDGREVHLLVSEVEDGDAAYAMAKDGPLANQVVTVNGYQAKNLRKKLEDLVE